MITIKRQNVGKTPTKFGIVLKLLKPKHRRILKNNPMIKKYSMDDRFILAIFRMEDLRSNISYLNKPSIHPVTKEISTFSKIKTSYKYCSKCFNYYIKDNKKYDKRIIESSLSFTEKCKQLMIDNQKRFLKYLKKNEK